MSRYHGAGWRHVLTEPLQVVSLDERRGAAERVASLVLAPVVETSGGNQPAATGQVSENPE